MKILNIGDIKYECPHCHSLLEIEKSDWRSVKDCGMHVVFNSNPNDQYIKCPICNYQITKNMILTNLNLVDQSNPKTDLILEEKLARFGRERKLEDADADDWK